MFAETRKGTPSPPRTELERGAQLHSRTEHAYAGYYRQRRRFVGGTWRPLQGASDVISTERRPKGSALFPNCQPRHVHTLTTLSHGNQKTPPIASTRRQREVFCSFSLVFICAVNDAEPNY